MQSPMNTSSILLFATSANVFTSSDRSQATIGSLMDVGQIDLMTARIQGLHQLLSN
jgi:hypothetical protein